MAAALALRLRNEGFEYDLAGQVLLYPMLQALDFHTPSYVTNSAYTSDVVTRRGAVFVSLMYGNLSRELYFESMLVNGHISAAAWDKYGDFISHTLLPKDMVPSDYRPVRQLAQNQWVELEDAEA